MNERMLKNVNEFENDEQLLQYLLDTDTEKEFTSLYDVLYALTLRNYVIKPEWYFTCSLSYDDCKWDFRYYRQGKRKVYQGGIRVSVRDEYETLYNCWKELDGKKTPLEILERVVSLSDNWYLELSNDGYYRRATK